MNYYDVVSWILTLLFISSVSTRGATTFSKLGVQFLGLWYYCPSSEFFKKSIPTLAQSVTPTRPPTKSYIKSWGSIQILEGLDPSAPSGCAHGKYLLIMLVRKLKLAVSICLFVHLSTQASCVVVKSKHSRC